MALLRKSSLQTADVEAFILLVRGKKYFTLAGEGVPEDKRMSMGVQLAQRGYNKFNMKVRQGVNSWVWLGEPGDTEYSYAAARQQLFGVTGVPQL